MKLLIPILVGAILLAGCEQDPLKGASDKVRNGRSPDSGKMEQPKPRDKAFLQIDAPTRQNGRVGSPIEFKIGGRILIPNVQFQLAILNLSEFPGATYNELTGEFSWTPSLSEMGTRPSIDRYLKIIISTVQSPTEPTISSETSEVLISVSQRYFKPILNVASAGWNDYMVGSAYKLDFTVEDLDALETDDINLIVRDCPQTSYTDSVAHVVSMDKVVVPEGTSGKYKGKVTVDLTYAKNLRKRKYCFAVSAMSRLGVISDPYKVEMNVAPQVSNTEDTATKAPVIKTGTVVRYNFSIYDPTNQGVVEIKTIDDLSTILAGSSVACERDSSMKWQQDCTALIDASALTEAKDYSFKIVTSNTLNSQTVQTTHTIKFKVTP